MVIDEIVECCPICGTDGEYQMTAPTRQGINLDVYSCPTCNVTYNSPRMTKDAMKEFYSSGEYFDGVREPRRIRGDFGERNRALRNVLVLMNSNVKRPNRCLDVGCSQGHFLARIRDWSFGVETVGYDLYNDPDAIRDVITGKSEVTGEFDLITCIHTLEHIHDPMAELEWMNSLLADDGILMLELPIVRYIMVEHPITFSMECIPVMMEHIDIGTYTTMKLKNYDSCIVFGKKGVRLDERKSNGDMADCGMPALPCAPVGQQVREG